MNINKRFICRLAALSLALLIGIAPAAAAEISVAPGCTYTLSHSDFSEIEMDGVYISSIPASGVCEIRYGTRTLRAGDVLPIDALTQLSVQPTDTAAGDGSLIYCPIADGCVGVAQEMRFSFLRGQNKAPTAYEGELETYKNIANTGKFRAEDPENDDLTYAVTKEPKRGTVEVHEDGTFTYTPKENKVGKDAFRFTATDAAGNVSNEALVSIRIVKPTDKAMYSDMAAQDGEYLAMWLKETGAYTGCRIAGNLCFSPDAPVTRGEFLVMGMQVFGAEGDDAALTAGFADEAEFPDWMQPYIVRALRSGIVSGSSTNGELYFYPTDALTRAEAAVMVQNILQLPQPESAAVFAADSAVPSWAQSAVRSLQNAGFTLDAEAAGPLTRLEAAKLLYDAQCVAAQPNI